MFSVYDRYPQFHLFYIQQIKRKFKRKKYIQSVKIYLSEVKIRASYVYTDVVYKCTKVKGSYIELVLARGCMGWWAEERLS